VSAAAPRRDGQRARHVALVAPHYRPETNAAAHRVTALAESLAAAGRQVTMITTLPHYPQYRVYDGYDVPGRMETEEGGVRVVRLRPLIAPKTSLPLRLLAELWFCLRAYMLLLRARPDVVVASSPYMFLGPMGLLAARLVGARFAWDVRDLTWLYPRAVGKRTFGLDRALERLMLWTARRCDALTTATEGLLTYFERRPELSAVVPNGVSDAWLDRLAALPAPGDAPQVLYAGLLGYNHALATLVDAARLLPDVPFALAGDGPERAELEERALRHGLTNVTFLGYLGPDELVEAYSRATVLVSHVRKHDLYHWTQPAKLWEYMATGRPVVHAGEGEAVRIVDENGVGVTVPPEDPDALAAAIAGLVRDPAAGRQLGARARGFVSRARRRSLLLAEHVALLERLAATER